MKYPLEYKGFMIQKKSDIEYHIYKSGVGVGIMAGLNGAKRRIDSRPLTLRVKALSKNLYEQLS